MLHVMHVSGRGGGAAAAPFRGGGWRANQPKTQNGRKGCCLFPQGDFEKGFLFPIRGYRSAIFSWHLKFLALDFFFAICEFA